MEKYGGWIANILDVCPDFTIACIEHEEPYAKVIAPLEASRTVEEVMNVLKGVSQEWVDRLNSPLVDALVQGRECCSSVEFLKLLCARGSLAAMEFCESKGVLWTDDATYRVGMNAAIEGNQWEVVQWLARKNDDKYLSAIQFKAFFPGMLRTTIHSLVQKKAFRMLRWMIDFLNLINRWEIVEASIQYDEVGLVEEIASWLSTFNNTLGATALKVEQHGAVQFAKAMHAFHPNIPYSASGCVQKGKMELFRWMMEGPVKRWGEPVDLFFNIVAEIDEARVGWEQLEYILGRFVFTEEEKFRVLDHWTIIGHLPSIFFFLIERGGFMVPSFPAFIKRRMYVVRDMTTAQLLKLFEYGVVADESMLKWVILNRENALLVLDRGGFQLLTNGVFAHWITSSSTVDEVVGNWFISTGFNVTEEHLTMARSRSVLEWCRAKNPSLTGILAFRECIQLRDPDKCELLVAAGFKPSEDFLQDVRREWKFTYCRNKSRLEQTLRFLELAALPLKRKSRFQGSYV